MSLSERWKPSTTVAAVIERDGRFLLIEEHTPEGLRLNNPAGHLDPGESPQEACVREVLEETAHAFTPTALLGIYYGRFQRPASPNWPQGEDISYMRFAFCGSVGEAIAGRSLDTGIVRTLWLTPDEVRATAAPTCWPAWKITCVGNATRWSWSARMRVCTDRWAEAPLLKSGDEPSSLPHPSQTTHRGRLKRRRGFGGHGLPAQAPGP
jgi:8-oxo-dGTP pyrophosphatase MutT (NUDIX family)